ncbi:hypothetical protein SAMN04488029_2627 [Reichenbachiella faecimaris]|uniref:Uncharacterized protein n=1 Tax=Reichenbachiella faecimaris TaxID=692418 RepID=A0A1W2GHE0_REIFA|nr:hypothetical protein [Reichenbachiella faecimaris]SMD35954.1 hypothetical protein SAMN04488029_2627 [Reichenbachiella faecimaris]
MELLYKDFISKLKKLFGKYDSEIHRFEKSSNSDISRELGYSDAQFSRLINKTATEGEYQRAIQNLDRILTIQNLESELKTGVKKTDWVRNKVWIFIATALLVLILLALMGIINISSIEESLEKIPKRDEMLRWTFETSFVSPYVKLDDLPEDCNYPCYKYQGKWKLKENYKIPFFIEKNGFHYLAKEASMYAKCTESESRNGNTLEGYEYQMHEIWYDKRELPIDSFIHENGSTEIKDFYQGLDFSKNPNFVKLATVHTFFRNEFVIDSAVVIRSGKVIGRDLEIRSRVQLLGDFNDESKVRSVLNELNRIATGRLEDFSRPIACQDAPVPHFDFHQIKDNDEMSFDCELTTSRVPLGYNKTYLLVDQYIKNSCRPNP